MLMGFGGSFILLGVDWCLFCVSWDWGGLLEDASCCCWVLATLQAQFFLCETTHCELLGASHLVWLTFVHLFICFPLALANPLIWPSLPQFPHLFSLFTLLAWCVVPSPFSFFLFLRDGIPIIFLYTGGRDCGRFTFFQFLGPCIGLIIDA